MTTRTKKQYRPGDWFAVPLTDSGYAVGIVARVGKGSRVFGYFFGPVYLKIPILGDVKDLSPDRSIYVARFGDLGLLKGSWPLLGHAQAWNPANWPLPPFARIDEEEGKAWRVEYSEDTLTVAREVPVSPNDVRHLPEDGFEGYRFVELRLSKLLKSSETLRR
jgi:hypothetical protein